eukprot:ANDGO_08068.mRNA.1 hypothetical protein PPTG_07415
MSSPHSSYYDEFTKKQVARADPKRLMTDKNAYIAYLEVQMERVTKALSSVRDYDERLGSIDEKVSGLAKLVKMSQGMTDSVHSEIKSDLASVRETVARTVDPESVSVKIASSESRFRSLLDGHAQDTSTKITRVDEDSKRLRCEIEELRTRQSAVENELSAYKSQMDSRLNLLEREVKKDLGSLHKNVAEVSREFQLFKEEEYKVVDDLKYKLASLAQAVIRHGDDVREQIHEEVQEMEDQVKVVEQKRSDAESAFRADLQSLTDALLEERDRRRELVDTVKKISDTLMDLPQAIDAKSEMRWKEAHKKISAVERTLEQLDEDTANRIAQFRGQLDECTRSMAEVTSSFSRVQMDNDRLKEKVSLKEKEARAWEGMLSDDLRQQFTPASHTSHFSPMMGASSTTPLSSVRLHQHQPPGIDTRSADAKIATLEGSLSDLRALVHTMEHSPAKATSSAIKTSRIVKTTEEDLERDESIRKKKTSSKKTVGDDQLRGAVHDIMGSKLSPKKKSSASASTEEKEGRRQRLKKLYEEVLSIGGSSSSSKTKK